MRKKDYLKPTMRVVKLQQRVMLMQASVQSSSTMSATRRSYGVANDGVEELSEGEWVWN